MKRVRFIVSLLITVSLIYILDNRWQVGSTPIPPLGKFLDPIHGFWQNIETKHYAPPKAINLTGLKDKVTIAFDSLLIPHITAANDEDLYLAQGYVTAMYRLWQMEFQTHAAAGRISEILGPGTDNRILDYDKKQRRLGLTLGARQMLEAIQENTETNRMVMQYTNGINQFIQSLRYKELPFEYKLLDYSPENWEPLKCALLLKSMAQSLNIFDKDFQMTNALNLLGSDVVDILYPDFEGVGDAVVDGVSTWNFKPVEITDSIPLALPSQLTNLQAAAEHHHFGSNNWAVSGNKTKTGSPILCNDPHLTLGLPSLWFVAQLRSPNINVMGATLPGIPTVVIGFNDSIAWALTNAERDLQDWYKITYKDASRNTYKLDSNWVPTQKTIEAIKVRGQGTLYDTVVYTRWGPVVYDRNFNAGSERVDYAFRWIAHDASNELLALINLNRAKNFTEYRNALKHFDLPAQNVAFASVGGDIAMVIQGKFPLRRKNEGKFILDGSHSSNGWQTFIPYDHNLYQQNPERGFVSSSNQYPADISYPYYVHAIEYEAYRNRRVNRVLTAKNNITVKDMMELQNDNYNLMAEEVLPLMVSCLEHSTLTSAELHIINQLKAWNYTYAADSEEAVYFDEWWENLKTTLWDELQNKNVSLRMPTDYRTVWLMKEKPDFSFYDIVETEPKENLCDVVLLSFKASLAKINTWKVNQKNKKALWGNYKATLIQHLTRLDPLSEPVINGGNGSTVNATTTRVGPSWRMIVSLEKTGIKAWGIYPGGQSGNPGSTYFNNMISDWANGRYYKITFLPAHEQSMRNTLFVTQLNPNKK
jgi:penicillin G amidase